MAYEKKEGDIAIFKNSKNGNQKAPDWRGEVLINGVLKDVALWEKGGKGTMLAGSVKDKWKPDFEKVKQTVRAPDAPASYNDLEDEIPF